MIPFILLGVSTVAGLTGVFKGAEGISNCLKAKNIVEKNRQTCVICLRNMLSIKK